MECIKNDCWIRYNKKKWYRKTSFIINDAIVSDSNNIANAFNNYFVSIGAELSDSISSNVNSMSYVSYVENRMFMPDLKECEVGDVILQLKNTSAGWDNLPTSIGKKCVDGYLAPLTYILNVLNMCIRQGVFPRELKLARVIPIFKSSSKQSISNYRPISILTFISKVFEKMLYNHISQFMDRNDTICSNQFGTICQIWVECGVVYWHIIGHKGNSLIVTIYFL